MSHYQSYKNSAQIKKYPSDTTPSYLQKKRADYEMDSSMKKRYDHEEKYDRYEKYDKYNQSSKYHMGYPNTYHGGSSNKYRTKDYYYSNSAKYHSTNYTNKSPRREYKKPYQKYNADNEGVRNLSHCDIPSPVKKKDDRADPKEGLLQGFNSLMRNFPSQQGAYQHIFQNQQNINISIISPKPLNLDSSQVMTSTVNSTTILSGPGLNSRRFSSSSSGEPPMQKERDKRDGNKNGFRNSYKDIDESTFPSPEKKYRSTIPKPPPKVPLTPFDRKDIQIPENPFKENTTLPILDYTPLNSLSGISSNNSAASMQIDSANSITPNVMNAAENIEKDITTLEPNYLLSKITNSNLVSNFVDISKLKDMKYENVPKCEVNTKSFLVYDEKYESTVEKFTEQNAAQKEKLKNEIISTMQNIDHFEHDIRKIQYKIYEKEWKFQKLSVKANAIDIALNDTFKQD